MKLHTPKLQRIGPYQVRIPRQGPMNTDGMIYASEELLEKETGNASGNGSRKTHGDNGSKGAATQVANVACLPGIVGLSMAMPDVHWGYGFPIGGVAAFDENRGGVISPGGVGYDINCGVRLHSTEVEASEVLDGLPSAIRAIYNTVPCGVGKSRRDLGRSTKEIQSILRLGAQWAIKKGLGEQKDLEHTEDHGCLEADPTALSSRAMERGRGQVGTLGSGNHFIELGRVAALYDPEGASAFGLFQGQLTVLLHSGSRGLGYQVCDDSIHGMIRAARKYGIDLPDRQLCCAPLGSPEAEEYFLAMGAAANFAFANRQVMGHQVGEILQEVLHKAPRELGYRLVYDVCHNIAKREWHQVEGKRVELCVHRKGATRALPKGDEHLPEAYSHVGQPVLVPGDLGTCSYVLRGLPGAAKHTFCSCCHGAGRVLSRKKALKASKGRSLFKELAQKGITVQAAHKRTLAEEMPEAYKGVSAVVEVVEQLGVAKVVAKLEPLAVIKG